MKDWDWQQIAAVLGIWTVVVSVLAFILRPLFDKLWIKVLERNKPEIKSILNGWYNVKDQGEVFQTIVRGQEQLKRETQEQSTALEDIQREVHQISLNLANLYGSLGRDPWDGQTDRRKH